MSEKIAEFWAKDRSLGIPEKIRKIATALAIEFDMRRVVTEEVCNESEKRK